MVDNVKFGTETIVKKSPQTVRYTINSGVKWSDGTPVTAADLLLDWASSISKNNVPWGVNFTSVFAGSGLDLATKASVSDDGQSLTLVYSRPNADWQSALPPTPLAAHAVFAVAVHGGTPAAANRAVVKAIADNDTSVLKKIAKAWSTGFDFDATPSNKLLDLSDGPYVISSVNKGTSISLLPNRSYSWGVLPKIDKFTFRVIHNPSAQVRALQNGQVNLVYGQGEANTAVALKKLNGVTTSVTSSSSYDHVDLTENSGGPFDAAAYGGDASKALAVRQAFMKALPRQGILDKLIKPLQPDAKLDNSLTILPGEPGYAASVADNGSSAYATVDIAAAKSDLAKAGLTFINVRFLYSKSDTRDAQEFALIRASEARAGIRVIDDGNDDWSNVLGGKDYDATLFAWQGSTLAATAGRSQWQTGGASNFNGFTSARVDSDYNKLQSAQSQSVQLKLLADVDKAGWADASTATLFQLPDINAWSSKLQNLSDSPLSPAIFWNFPNWTVSSGAK